jgi:PleD family two-component response regulator
MRMDQPVDVLVIEDRRCGSETILDALRQQVDGICATAVESGEAALHFLANCAVLPKIVLLDTLLLKIDPFELLRRIRSAERTRSLPVFLMIDPKDQERKTSTPYVMVNGYIPRTAGTQILAERLTILRHLVGRNRKGLHNVFP